MDSVNNSFVFDSQRVREFVRARQEFLAKFLTLVQVQMSLESAVDVGCAVGDFSKFLFDRGLRVVAIDGREENVIEARKRYPEISFSTGDVENLCVAEIGSFDFVLCFGLLYHLENPFRAIRNLYALTDKVLLVEGMCVPASQATMELLDEDTGEDQGFSNAAFYPSESCLIKMLYRAGFALVYRFGRLPAHELYNATVWRKRPRTILAASKVPLTASELFLVHERFRRAYEFEPWVTWLRRLPGLGEIGSRVSMRVSRFWRRPWTEKREIMAWYVRRFLNRASLTGTK